MSLENHYRRLLRAYPHTYRERRGEEMLSTLLDAAAPGQTRPARGETADLLVGAVRERLGLHAVPGFAVGLRVAGSACLAFAAAHTVSTWLAGTVGRTAVVLGVAWLLAALAYVLVGRLVTRAHAAVAVAVAWVATVGAALMPPPTIVTGAVNGQPFEWAAQAGVYNVALVAGFVALLATAAPPPAPGSTMATAERAGVALTVAGAALATHFVEGAVNRSQLTETAAFASPSWTAWWLAVPVVALLAGTAEFIARRTTGGLWATGLTLLPVTMTVGWTFGGDAMWGFPPRLVLVVIPPASQAALLGAVIAVTVLLAAERATGAAGGSTP
ncbi:hypothetical protein ACFQX7_16800 [Luedemannella flava]